MNTGREIGDAPLLLLKDLFPNNKPDWEKIETAPSIEEIISSLKTCPQDALHHAEGDVFTHTQMVLEEMQKLDFFQQADILKQYILLVSALLHDIGKPPRTKEENGRIVSPNHAQFGEKMARQLLWDEDFALREQICSLVRLHGLPLWAFEKPNPNAAVTASSLRLSNADLHALATADALGRICQDQQDLMDRLDLFQELCLENECFEVERIFQNSHSRFKFFANNLTYPPALYDDTAFEVVLMCGISGSGKDVYIQENLDMPIVSLDALRTQMKVKRRNTRGQGHVIQAAYQMAKEFGAKKQSFVWNAMNLSQDLRQKVISKMAVYNPKFRIIYIETSRENIIERRSSEIKVSELEWMMQMLEMPKPNEAHEVLYLRNG